MLLHVATCGHCGWDWRRLLWHVCTPSSRHTGSSADEGGRDGSEEVGSKENVGSTFADGRGPTKSNATEGDVTGDGDAATAPATATATDDGAAEAVAAPGAPPGPEADATDAAASS